MKALQDAVAGGHRLRIWLTLSASPGGLTAAASDVG